MHTQPTNVAQAARRGRGAALLLIALALALILVFIIPALSAAQNFQGEDHLHEDHLQPVLRAETVAFVAPDELLTVNVSGRVDGDCHPRRRTTVFPTFLVLFAADGDVLAETELSVPQNGFATAEFNPADLRGADPSATRRLGVRVEVPVCDAHGPDKRSRPPVYASLHITGGEDRSRDDPGLYNWVATFEGDAN